MLSWCVTQRALVYVVFLMGCGTLGLGVADSVAAADLYVVAAKSVKGHTGAVDVAGIITGKQRKWENGAPIVVILPSKDAPHFQTVGDHWFNGSGSAMQRHWLRLVFSGRANVPIYAKNDAEVLAILDQTEGAVGIVKDAPPEAYLVLSEVN
jgi:hypothetical protein